MTTQPVARFDIEITRYLDAEGMPCGALPAFAADPAALRVLYRAMLRTRAFDAKAVALQRTGRLGTFASSLGQEAVGVGAASSMQADDVLVPAFRDQAAQLWRGVTPLELLLYWGATSAAAISPARGRTSPSACRWPAMPPMPPGWRWR